MILDQGFFSKLGLLKLSVFEEELTVVWLLPVCDVELAE
jgi:hypothetical protein